MTAVLEALSIVAGAVIVIVTLWSAMLTVVVPRSERPYISRWHFALVGWAANLLTSRLSDPALRDRLLSRMAPFGLVTLPFVWALHITAGFAFMFRGLSVDSLRDAFVLSGSSLTTLGIGNSDHTITLALVIFEGLIGLGLVGLVISYLPTIYGAFTEREVAVARLEVRAGRPPHPVSFLNRTNEIGWLGHMEEVWAEWEDWFLHIEETHTTHTSLAHFRSAYHGRNWLVTAGTILDTAALIHSTIDVHASPRIALCLRSGFTTLGSISDALEVEHPNDPHWPEQPISMSRETFDALCDELERLEIPLVADRDDAWRNFAGWRVNYDASLYGLFDALRFDAGAWFGAGAVTTPDLASADGGYENTKPE
ncbi:MAG: hypothetical protein AAF567_05805 [Actinomycetota bacterium]